MMCLGEVPTMCVVPCGHLLLCVECAGGLRFGRGRGEMGACPVCCGRMESPWVMEGGEWARRGGKVYG